MTKKELIELKLKPLEKLLENGIHNAGDLKLFKEVYKPAYSWRSAADSDEKILNDFNDYIRRSLSKYNSFYYGEKNPFEGLIDKEDLPNYTKLMEDYWTSVNEVVFTREFIKKITYCDEKVYSFFEYENWFVNYFDSFNDDIKVQILTYHLKKKPSKSAFHYLLKAGILNDEILAKIKLTDKQLTNLVFSEFTNLRKKRISIGDITDLKRLRMIKGSFTEGSIIEIANKFVKDSEAEKVSAGTIEVILTMFFHYLDLDFNDYPGAKLLIELGVDGEVDV